MRLIIHDLDSGSLERLGSGQPAEVHVISPDSGPIHHCLGCFGCWVKTPGACVIADSYSGLGELFSRCSEVDIITRCLYGGYSPFVKNVLDRSISYMQPFFTIKDGEMRHKRRYHNRVRLRVIFYGDITPEEEETARGFAQANAVNLGWELASVSFYRDLAGVEGWVL